MATVQSEILDDFFTRLSKAEDLDAEQVQELRTLFISGDTIKAENLVAIFSARKKAGGML